MGAAQAAENIYQNGVSSKVLCTLKINYTPNQNMEESSIKRSSGLGKLGSATW